MSEATEESKSQYEDESVTQTTVETTEITENEEDKGEDLNEQHAPEEQSSILEDIQEEAKEEETQDEGSAEKVQEAAEEEAAPAADEVAVEGEETENVEDAKQETAEADAGQETVAEPSPEEEGAVEKQEEAEEVPAEEVHEDERTEGEKLLAEIDTSKVIEETDTEIEYQPREVVFDEVSHITLNPDEQPEIRGLAELEYESPDDSQKEVTFDEYVSRRKSVRQSVAGKLLAEEEAAEKRRKARREMAKGKKILEEEEIQEVVDIPLTREEYYTLHEKLFGEISYIRMKNKYLQRKMADFFKKRKMEHALKEEVEIHVEAVQKYEKKLDRLAGLLDVYNAETTRIGNDIDLLNKEKEDKYLEKSNIFNKAVSREREIGIGLISTKTGKEIPDKAVEQLIRRQVNASKQISDLRLKYITLRDELAEKTAELKALDNIGDDLSLMDYEQLKIENRAHSDKLEEKEEELTKLRVKCRNAVQIMAHVREKSAALDADMDVLKEEFDEVHFQYIEIRERLNFYKTERDVIRNKTMKLKEESGLLTKPKLLQDMETSMTEVKLYDKTLEKVKNEYNQKTQQIRNLRKNIAYEMVMSKKHHREKRKKKTTAKYYKVRPTLIVPKLEKNFLDRLATNLQNQDNEE